jgi:hypothetical protein
MVQANSNLTWRDMQHITVRTAKRANLEVSSWGHHEIFCFWFFHKSVSPQPQSILLGPFQNFENFVTLSL